MEQYQPTAQFPITAIIGCLEDTNDPNVPRKAACILSDLKVAPELCAPALVAGLQSKSPFTRASSAWALGRFGEQAASAIGALTNVMADSDSEVRFNVANALHAIAPVTYTNVPPPPYSEECFIHPRSGEYARRQSKSLSVGFGKSFLKIHNLPFQR